MILRMHPSQPNLPLTCASQAHWRELISTLDLVSQVCASSVGHSRRNTRRVHERVGVAQRVGVQVALRSRVAGSTAKVVVDADRVPDLLRIDAEDGRDDVAEHAVLDKGLGAHARVDGGAQVLVVRVVDVGGAEPQEGRARVDVLPVVVGVGDLEPAPVLVAVAVRVAHQGGLPVVVEARVADGDEVGAVRRVDEAVVEVLVAVEGGAEVAVVDPDVGGLFDLEGVASRGGLDVGRADVAQDEVALAAEVEGDAVQGWWSGLISWVELGDRGKGMGERG